MDKRFFYPEPRVIAHRGASGKYPENTAMSFRKAVEIGADVIETDIHFTKDNGFIVCHDDVLERVSDGTGRVGEHTVAELKRLDAGCNFAGDGSATFPYRGKGLVFMTLEEMLEEFPGQRFNIDLKAKNPGQVPYYADIIKKMNAQHRVLSASEYGPNTRAVRKIFPDMATSYSMGEGLWYYFLYRSSIILLVNSFPAEALQIPEYLGTSHIVTGSFVSMAHRKGIRVHVWTVNEEKDMRRLFDAGVDGIVSDNPVLLKKVVADYYK
jgi:glycerophosphoryl diester phosphodiesterase